MIAHIARAAESARRLRDEASMPAMVVGRDRASASAASANALAVSYPVDVVDPSGVVPRAAVDPVSPAIHRVDGVPLRPGVDRVTPFRACGDPVAPPLAKDTLATARAALETIRSVAADKQVPAGAAVQTVAAVTAEKPIVARRAGDAVIAALSKQAVVVVAASHDITAGAGIDAIFTGQPVDYVVACEAEDLVTAGRTVQDVGSIGTRGPIDATAHQHSARARDWGSARLTGRHRAACAWHSADCDHACQA